MILLYFDPGLGAMIIQSVIAAVAGFILFSKNIMYKIKVFFGLVSRDNDDDFDDINVKETDIENKDNFEK